MPSPNLVTSIPPRAPVPEPGRETDGLPVLWGVHEPATTATDYLLGVICIVLGARLGSHATVTGHVSIAMWGGALVAMAAGALAGGTYHGFAPRLSIAWQRRLWALTVRIVGFSSFFLVAGVAFAALAPSSRALLLALAGAKLAAYLAWTRRRDAFVYVIADHLPALLVVLFFGLLSWSGGRSSGPWLTAGVLVACAGGLVQGLRLAPHRVFNHNDVFHVLQMLAAWLLYEGGMRLRDIG